MEPMETEFSNRCVNRTTVHSPGVLYMSPADTDLDFEQQIREHFALLDRLFKEEEVMHKNGICQAAFTFVTNNLKEHWEIVDRVRKEYWGDEKPTSTFIETARRPDNRPWGNSAIAFEPVIYYNPLAVTDYYLETTDENRFPEAAYCHAKKVETDDSFELYFSGMCGVAGDPESETGIRIVADTIYQQANTALMYCRQLCEQAGVTHQHIHKVDIFYCQNYEPARIVEQAHYFFREARINVIPVTALFMPGVFVEIRPHATIWKK